MAFMPLTGIHMQRMMQPAKASNGITKHGLQEIPEVRWLRQEFAAESSLCFFMR